MAISDRLMSKSAFAKHRGVAPSVVTSYLKTGKIGEKDGKIDWKKADAILDSILSKTKGGRQTPKDAKPAAKKGAQEGNTNAKKETHEFAPGSMAAIRIAREQLALDKQRIDFELMVGKLCNTDRVTNVVRRNLEASVKVLERFPDKLAPRMAVETREFEIRRILRAEIVELCAELAKIADSFPESLTATEQ